MDSFLIVGIPYRMVTGMDPDDAEARLVRDILSSLFQLGAAVTEKQSDAIMTGLAMDTLVRFQTMQAFLTALTAGERKPSAAAAPAAKERRPCSDRLLRPPVSWHFRILEMGKQISLPAEREL